MVNRLSRTGFQPEKRTMTGVELVTVGVAAIIAGAVGALAGGGTLITFPVLLAVGVPPVAANVTNTDAGPTRRTRARGHNRTERTKGRARRARRRRSHRRRLDARS